MKIWKVQNFNKKSIKTLKIVSKYVLRESYRNSLFFIKSIKIIQEILTSYSNLSIIFKISFNYILSIE